MPEQPHTPSGGSLRHAEAALEPPSGAVAWPAPEASDLDRVGARRAPVARLRSRGVADAAILAGLLIFSALVTWVRVRVDRGFFNGDILTQFIPLYNAVTDRLLAGDLPGWNPALFSGMPLAGDPISGWGYLPAIVFSLLFGVLGAYQAHIYFHLALAGVATYLLGRRLGLSLLGALAASLAFELGPHVYFAKCCTARMQLGQWIPLGLLTVEMGARSRSWTGRILWWGATGLVISQVIAGYFGKGAYYGTLTIGAFAAYRTLIDPPEPLRLRERLIAAATHCGAILAFGFGFSAVSVLPRLDFMDRANLEGGSYEAVAPEAARAAGWSLGRALTNVLNPGDLKYFVGAVTVALAIAGVVLAGRRFAVPFFALFSFSVLMLTLQQTPIHTLAYLLPQFRVIHEHVPPRILVIFNIGPAMLAGAAVTMLQRKELSVQRLFAAAVAILGSAAAITLIADRDRVPFDSGVRTALVIVALLLGGTALLILLLRTRSPRHVRWVSTAAAGILVLALAWNLGNGLLDRARASGLSTPPLGAVPLAYADRTDTGQAGAFLREVTAGDPARYLGYDAAYLNRHQRNSPYYHAFEDDLQTEALLVNNRAVLLGLEDAQGYNPVHSMRYVEYIDAMNGQSQAYHETNLLRSGIGSPLLDLLNVRYIVVPASVPPGRPDLLRLSQLYPTVYLDDKVRVIENRSALPRAWIVHQAQQVEQGGALPLLVSGAIDPRQTALLESAPPPLAAPTGAPAETVSITRSEPDRVTITAGTSADGLLILSQMYDPGWHAYVDGERVTVQVANHLFQAVPLPAGTHTVEVRYEPRSLLLGLGITALTGAGLIAVAAFAIGRWWLGGPGRRRRSHSPVHGALHNDHA